LVDETILGHTQNSMERQSCDGRARVALAARRDVYQRADLDAAR